jgi:hypothetical protein
MTVLAAGCGGDDDGGDAEAFCAEVGANQGAIVNPALATDDDVEATVGLYRELGELAPLAIGDEWDDLVVNVETASTVTPDDPESVQRAVATAYATERSAVAVRDWVLSNCGVDLGPVATIAPQGPAATTTLPPDVSTSVVAPGPATTTTTTIPTTTPAPVDTIPAGSTPPADPTTAPTAPTTATTATVAPGG